MTQFTKQILKLEDPNIILYEKMENIVKNNVNGTLLFGRLTYTPTHCSNKHCHAKHPNIVKNGTRSSLIYLNAVAGYPTYLKLEKQRFYCHDCKQSFTAKTNLVSRNCCVSNPLKQWMMNELTEVTSETKIAKLASVSVSTVRRLVTQLAKTITHRPTDSLPAHLSFDEFKSVKSSEMSMSFVFCDSKTHQLIDVVQDRKQFSLKQYFLRYDLKVRQAVKTITIDMYKPYMALIQELFPNAKIILDRFHIVQALNRELNRERVKVMNAYRYKDMRLYNKYKRYWKLILKNPNELNGRQYSSYRLFDHLTNTNNIVDYLLDENERLKEQYNVVHQLTEALSTNNAQEFEMILKTTDFSNVSAGLKRVIRTLKGYLSYIYNTCKYAYTNGPIEGINNKIKVLKRNAYGYRNFSHFRHRILLMTKLYSPEKKEKQIRQPLIA